MDNYLHDYTKFLPSDFIPGSNDVLMGRGKKCTEHVGNERFRRLVASKLDEYSGANKREKTALLLSIVKQVRMGSPTGGFIKLDSTAGLWFEVGDFLAREKVSQAFRDALHDCYRSSNAFKKKRKREQSGKKQSSGHLLKRSRSQRKPSVQQEEQIMVDWRNSNLLTSLTTEFEMSSESVGLFDDDIFKLPSSLPDSSYLSSWFEKESDPFSPIPISSAPRKDVELFEPFQLPGDFDKFLEELNDNNDFSATPKNGDEVKCQSMGFKKWGGNHQPTILKPSRNSCAARMA